MHEMDAHRYWKLQGSEGNALIQKAQGFLAAYGKANKNRKRELLALLVSVIKAKCYEDGIRWAEMALSEQRFVGSIPEMPAILRPEKEQEPEPETPPETVEEPEPVPTAPPVMSKKKLMRFKKEELAEEVKKLQEKMNEIAKLEDDDE